MKDSQLGFESLYYTYVVGPCRKTVQRQWERHIHIHIYIHIPDTGGAGAGAGELDLRLEPLTTDRECGKNIRSFFITLNEPTIIVVATKNKIRIANFETKICKPRLET